MENTLNSFIYSKKKFFFIMSLILIFIQNRKVIPCLRMFEVGLILGLNIVVKSKISN